MARNENNLVELFTWKTLKKNYNEIDQSKKSCQGLWLVSVKENLNLLLLNGWSEFKII